MAMLRRKTTPKRLRLEINLDDDDEIPPCPTFIVPPKPPTNTDTQKTKQKDCSTESNCLDEKTSSQTVSISSSSAGSTITMASPIKHANSASDDDELNKANNQLPTLQLPQLKASPIRKSVSGQEHKSNPKPVSDSSNHKLPVKKQKHKHESSGHSKTSHIATNNDSIRPVPLTSTPKSKDSMSSNSSKTQMASLKPLAKSMNNQVYLENKTHFNWNVYLELCPAEVAPKEAFMQARELLENKFEVNMKLEAKDPRGKDVWSVATVVSKEGLRIKLRLDGGDKLNDFYELIDSANIRPCQSNPNQLLYAPVGYRGDISNYANYVHKIFTNPETIFANQDIFPPQPARPKANLFKVGMKLESIDDKNPHMICPSTVAQVLDNGRIKVMFDGWSEAYALVYPYDSRQLFPVNWCRDTGHQIVPPLRWDKFLEDGQPLVDIDKIIARASNQNTSSNKRTTTARTSRSSTSNLQQVETTKYKHNNNNFNSNKNNNDSNKKLVKKAKKKYDKNSKTVSTNAKIASHKPKASSHIQQPQQQQLKTTKYLLEPQTPQQILQQNKLLRMERQKNNAKLQLQLERTAETFTMDKSLIPLPETSALLKSISSDEQSDQSVMKSTNKNKNSQQQLLIPEIFEIDSTSSCVSLNESSITTHDDDYQIWSAKHPGTPIILSKVNLIPAPVQDSSSYKSN